MLQISHLLVRDSFTRFVWSANDFSQRLRGGTVISKFSHCVFHSGFRLVLIYFFRVRLVNDYADMRTSRTSKSSKVVWTNLNLFRFTVNEQFHYCTNQCEIWKNKGSGIINTTVYALSIRNICKFYHCLLLSSIEYVYEPSDKALNLPVWIATFCVWCEHYYCR